ncbi:uncharacterized protein TRIVIDRAFT_66767 [Trichoderma virens Gv29-8]|uniref:Uncharacterized protein n=1 Tax=Hypocrea virens (strain Gv29-8 / FGSC 10586) TaxID=413071 RepID=G9N345_HYPVG|nr:uncharacterized protein TRIVIDRAFT_66767 [Trichoderma virens Gv29-8]EHK18730.1 hypothetical protein TRIVIDRAFT_66767 [Trichoderma virens Gv29-8]UKZ56509.1 hypothetical protein TrVGV298_010346 [Trichoderma virens]
MPLFSELANRRARLLHIMCRCDRQIINITNMQALRAHLELESASPYPKTMVLPGWIDVPTWQTLFNLGGPDWGFYNDHLRGHPCRAYQHRARVVGRWIFPQFVPRESQCTETKYSCAHGNVVLLSVSLWNMTMPILLVGRPDFTAPPPPFEHITMEDEILQIPAKRGLTLEAYINLLVYHRWETFISALRPGDMTQDMVFAVARALENNYDQAGQLGFCTKGAYFADTGAWNDMISRLQRRWDVVGSEVGQNGQAGPDGQPRENGAVKEDGTVVANGTARPDERIRVNGTARLNGTIRPNGTVEPDDMIMANGTALPGETTRLNGAVQLNGATRPDETIMANGAARPYEPIRVNGTARPNGSIGPNGAIRPGEASTANGLYEMDIKILTAEEIRGLEEAEEYHGEDDYDDETVSADEEELDEAPRMAGEILMDIEVVPMEGIRANGHANSDREAGPVEEVGADEGRRIPMDYLVDMD